MKVIDYQLYEEFEVERPESADGRLSAYLLDNYEDIDPNRRRPAVLVIPGGAYLFCSNREAEGVAMQFLAKGFQAFVLHYSVSPAKYPTQLVEASMAMAFIRRNSESLLVDRERVGVIGFSAGGHLAGTLSVLYNDHNVYDVFDLEIEENKPDFSVLCYAVLDHEVGHAMTYEVVSGGDEDLKEYLSLPAQVHRDVPPTFLWCTANDATVDCRNSLRYADALKAMDVPFELHIFESGVHGLSIADRETETPDNPQLYNENVQVWVRLCINWLKKRELVL